MSLYSLKPWFVRRLGRAEDTLVRHRVSPDRLTAVAVAVSFAAGGAIAAGGFLRMPALWLAVAPLGLGRLALNALGGSIARRKGRAPAAGPALDQKGDPHADTAAVG